ncbi:hypothetical protein CcaverHIS641_0403890 [Cutaneotrichosporon cavernicola]|nr:hypothetical protein CcaverHIS641_0403890 [Cutaneotrichosporon cavernicola]
MFQDGHGTLTQARAPVEIMNTPIGAKDTVRTSMACWIANFMIGQVSPWRWRILAENTSSSLFCAGSRNAATIWSLFPETKGRTLEEMDHYFEITQWFVPLAMYEGIDAGARERELAAAGENADDGESIEHCESV